MSLDSLEKIQKHAKKQSRKKNYWGWFQNLNAGNVPLNNAIFNDMMDTSDISGAGEADGGIGMTGAVGEELEVHKEEGIMPDQIKFYYCASEEDPDSKWYKQEVDQVVVDKQDAIRALISYLTCDPDFVDMTEQDLQAFVIENWDQLKEQYSEVLYDIFHQKLAGEVEEDDQPYDYDDTCECECEDAVDPFLTQYTFQNIDSEDPTIKVTEYETIRNKFLDESWEDKDTEDRYQLIAQKQVYDADGFTTDYALYYDHQEDKYVTVFGDTDFYKPEDGDFDAEFDDEASAKNWFDNYKGFDEEEFEECLHAQESVNIPMNTKKVLSPYEDRDNDLLDLSDEDANFWSQERDSEIEPPADYLGEGEKVENEQSDLSDLSDEFLDDYAGYDSDWMEEKSKRHPFAGYLDSDDEDIGAGFFDDQPLEESYMSDLDIDIRDPEFVERLEKNIAALESELSFLKDQAPKEIHKGGAFDSQEEIDDAIDMTQRELQRERAKLAIVKRSVEKK